ncbi:MULTISPECIES: adenine phosphoribosyltransferase [Prochlorococcus]|uniref:Adenine phosphoribosyltransferase n=1 Tax=Prochlorococcus marinus (strain SARG / CCMP1375 / SS120) TaxID=167539 RepID=APT_PROMA|nr:MULTISPECIES: adenine phosphoribosyltransferase [Prochlorococcus]Q7VAL5.1 RecName: Full=Adenine phosphoribosyltransferase; Short=APRT [Prochlorococcus marinus subsp. marinus str. CCMP1375]AAQ00489.1 Adenine/guanine phosphoribosyltransferases [Prochlorococcus marinus subsp. marinus str. CCMP1375]KGG14371.1 Adenine phosphoribosyltransferase [Prochlorococcus marinus str. LG]KGG22055.1 Adenine phosphoribosyltransferase [Prochlorococcus marinus str. SS2]KGG24627.1 Adenine phosphoribosyltransfera
MIGSKLKEAIRSYSDFPKKGILFHDISPIFCKPDLYQELIEEMAKSEILNSSDAIISIDARGFLFGSCISLKLSKPLILARKAGKLPGPILSSTYNLEYGENSLSIQKESLNEFKNFAIIDDVLATGGTINCVKSLLTSHNKNISGACVVIELLALKAREKLDFPIYSTLTL